ncbi:MAG: biopolymer transporter ExbD [Rhodobacteraceae bacterium]|nr:biopolymer transporter ExbD [Paracoccaceae bacterium]
MKKIAISPIQRKSENTISLINIVFLMLIFFLIAGQLAPPMDKEVELIDTSDAPALPPPDGLVARKDGALFYQNEPVSAESYIALARAQIADGSKTAISQQSAQETTTTSAPTVRLIADKNLSALKLVSIVSSLQKVGAGKVTIVTQRGQ